MFLLIKSPKSDLRNCCSLDFQGLVLSLNSIFVLAQMNFLTLFLLPVNCNIAQ